jgi:hypothetical protein
MPCCNSSVCATCVFKIVSARIASRCPACFVGISEALAEAAKAAVSLQKLQALQARALVCAALGVGAPEGKREGGGDG